MATTLTPAQLKNIEPVPYHKIREYLKTGDLVFCSGEYLFSRIIQRLTKSTWSHVAIIYKDEELGRVLVLEAEARIGIRLIPLSSYLKDYSYTRRPYKGKIFISSLQTPLDKPHLNKGVSFGLDELTRPYDNWEIIRIFLRILFKKGKREKNRNYICSELVQAIYAKAGVNFKFTDSYISPDGIWKDERVEAKYRVL
jgi:Permuted papain-like amidase enzyme, YaeF/YiiX, C92 family